MDDRRMVLKDPTLAAKKRRGKQQRSAKFTSDELFFNDDFQDNALAYGDDYGSSESERDYGGALVPARSRKGEDDALLDRALDRIQRAKAKGKPSVSLTHEELAALERRNPGPSDADRQSSERHKPRREDSGSSSNTSPNNGGRSRHKKQPSRPSSGFFGGSNSPRPTSKRSSKAMRSDAEGRPSTRGRDDTPPRASRPAPVAYYNARADRRAASGDEGRRRPAPSLRERYSDEQAYPTQSTYRAYNPNTSAPRDRDVDRGYRSDAGYRAPSDPYRSARAPYPVPDNLVQYEVPGEEGPHGDAAVSPAARHSVPVAYSNSSRRIVSGPADANYSTVIRRVPVGSRGAGDISARGLPLSGSDPTLDSGRRRVPVQLDVDSEDDDSDDDEDDEVRPRTRRQDSGTPPIAYTTNGVGRTRSGSTGWARRKR